MRFGGPDDVGDVVQDKGAQDHVGDVFVGAGGLVSAAAAAGVNGGADPVCPPAVLVGSHIGAALGAAQEAAEDVDVLPDVGLPGGHAAPPVSLEQELEAGEESFVQNGLVVVLDSDPLILRSFVGPLAAGMDVVDVLPDVPRVGEHRAHGVGVPGLAAPGEYAGLIHEHDEVWEAAFDAIFKEYNRLGDLMFAKPEDGEAEENGAQRA